MKYKSRELGKPKQFQELLGYLTAFLNDKETDSTPLDTASTMNKIACYHRMPSEFTENIDSLKLAMAFGDKYADDEKILWHCLRALGEFGFLSTQEKCKLLCFNYLSKFRNHKSKKICHLVVWNSTRLYLELLKKEPDWFDYAVSLLDLPPANESFYEFSLMLDKEISSMSNAQISIVIEKYEKFLKKTKSEYYQKRFTKLVDLLKKHVAGKIVLTPADLEKTRDV